MTQANSAIIHLLNIFRLAKMLMDDFYKSTVVFILFIGNFLIVSGQQDTVESIQIDTINLSSKQQIKNYLKQVTQYEKDLPLITVLGYYDKGLRTAQALSLDTLSFTFALKLANRYYYYLQDTDQALQYELKTYEIAHQMDSPKHIGIASTCVGVSLLEKRAYVESLDYLTEAIEYYKLSDNPSDASYPLGNIPIIYFSIGDYKSAITHLYQCLPYAKQLSFPDNAYSLAYDYLFLSKCFTANRQIDSSAIYLHLALEQVQQIDTLEKPYYQKICGEVYSHLAQSHLAQQEMEAAENYIGKAALFKAVVPAYYYPVLLQYYLVNQNLAKAKELFPLIPDTIEDHTFQKYALELQAQYFALTEDRKKQLVIQGKCDSLGKEVATRRQVNYKSFAEARLQSLQQREQIRQLTAANKSKDLKMQLLQIGFICMFSLLLLFLASYTYATIQKRKTIPLLPPKETSLKSEHSVTMKLSEVNPDESANLLNPQDQEWLTTFDATILPLIGDYQLNLNQVANAMAVSQSQLNRKVKQVTGFTPKRYIQELRFREALRLLESKEEQSVKAVAYAVGFKSQKHFSRNFKNRFGKYPSEYLV